MLKDRLIQSPHCPHGETEPLKREGAWTMRGGGGSWTRGRTRLQVLPTRKPQPRPAREREDRPQVPAGWHADQPAAPGPAGVGDGAGWA